VLVTSSRERTCSARRRSTRSTVRHGVRTLRGRRPRAPRACGADSGIQCAVSCRLICRMCAKPRPVLEATYHKWISQRARRALVDYPNQIGDIAPTSLTCRTGNWVQTPTLWRQGVGATAGRKSIAQKFSRDAQASCGGRDVAIGFLQGFRDQSGHDVVERETLLRQAPGGIAPRDGCIIASRAAEVRKIEPPVG